MIGTIPPLDSEAVQAASPAAAPPPDSPSPRSGLAREIRAMLRSARALLPSEDLAWDAVQEALLGTWSRRPEALAEEGGPDLSGLAFRRGLHLLRGRRRRLHHETAREHALPPREDETPLEALVREEQRAAVRTTLASLDEPHRRVLELRYFEEAGYDEIAAGLALAPGTVGSRLHRARGALRRRLEETP